jgi:hypothetical protein
MCIWQTPGLDNTNDSAVVCIDKFKVSGDAKLTCITQTSPNQVWAGTNEGTIIGWNVTMRYELSGEELPLIETEMQCQDERGKSCPVLSIISTLFVKTTEAAINVYSAGHDSLCKFSLS